MRRGILEELPSPSVSSVFEVGRILGFFLRLKRPGFFFKIILHGAFLSMSILATDKILSDVYLSWQIHTSLDMDAQRGNSLTRVTRYEARKSCEAGHLEWPGKCMDIIYHALAFMSL